MIQAKDCRGFIEAGLDLDAAVQGLLREAYEEATEDLRFYTSKLKEANKCKKAYRKYLRGLRAYQATVISTARERRVDIFQTAEDAKAQMGAIMAELSTSLEVDDVAYGLGIPSSVPPDGVNTVEELEAYIEQLEEDLQSVGDDAQLANVDMQNMLQKQQQTLQMMSQISKTLHDTAMAVVRKMGG